MKGPLDGITVLDFGTMLPVPLAALILAEAGAEVIKVERPGGDPFRSDPASFALLNRGKRSVEIDLKLPDSRARLLPLIRSADILLEQFRPGVMQRLGLDYETLRLDCPRLIYCSVTGYGATGPMAQVPGHDLTYAAETGLLSLTSDAHGVPGMPAALVADIGGGTFPAIINVLLALIRRNATGLGCWIDVAMHDNLFPFLFWVQARGQSGDWPQPNDDPATGGSPRYRIYRTKDGRFLAVAAAEPQFWTVFCKAIGLPDMVQPRTSDAEQVCAIAERVRQKSAAEWEAVFQGKNTVAAIVRRPEEAFASAQVRARGLLAHRVSGEQGNLPALPVPLSPEFRRAPGTCASPLLGEGNAELL